MLDDMKIGDLVRIANALAGTKAATAAQHPLVGKYVICRGTGAGVHAGVLVQATEAANGTHFVLLEGSRRLWSWTAKSGVALSGLAAHGLKSGKIDAKIRSHSVAGVVEIIPCSDHTQETINAA